MSNPSDPITDAEIARVKELDAKAGWKDPSGFDRLLSEYRTLAPRLADEIERLRAENESVVTQRKRWEESWHADTTTLRADLTRAHEALREATDLLESFKNGGSTDNDPQFDVKRLSERTLKRIRTTVCAHSDEAFSEEKSNSEWHVYICKICGHERRVRD